MSEHVPDSFDPRQPDLPSMAVDPDPDEADGVDLASADPEDLEDGEAGAG